jgi:hypothetical protein
MGVLVIGMHRSGTSALAGALEALGLDAGAPGGLMAADSGNPEGYFEQIPIADLDDEILKFLGGRWDSPPALRDGWEFEAPMVDYVGRIRNVVGSLYRRGRYVLKDPRISLLLPLWRQTGLEQGCAVVIVREPTEVARSLTKRNQLPVLTGLALWASYNRTLLRDLSGLKVHVCTYADLVERPATVLSQIVDSLRAWGELPEHVDLEGAAARVKPDLRRNTEPVDDVARVMAPPEIVELLAFMTGLSGRHDTFDAGTVPEPGWWEEPLLEDRRLLIQRSTAEIDELEAHNSALEEENAVLRQDNEAAHRELGLIRRRVGWLRRLIPPSLYRALRGRTDA